MEASFSELMQRYGIAADPVPDGEYDVVCIHAELNATRGDTPKHMIRANFKILAGPMAERVAQNNFTLTTDSSGAMYHWFRNFAFLGFDSAYFNRMSASGMTMVQQLQQLAAELVNRTAHVKLDSAAGRQNMNFVGPSMTPVGGMSAPAPAPQPGYGMQPQMQTPQFQQPQVPGQPVMGGVPGMPQAPQPQVAPPGMPQQPAATAAPQPNYQVPGQQFAPQPQQPMAAPNPMDGAMPQPQAAPPATQAQGVPGMAPQQAPQPQYPQPPGMEQMPAAPQQPAVAPVQAQPVPVPPGMQAPDASQGQQPLPIPGSPPPSVPV